MKKPKILKTYSAGWIVTNYGIPISMTFAHTRRRSIANLNEGWPPGHYQRGKRRGMFQVVKVRLVEMSL